MEEDKKRCEALPIGARIELILAHTQLWALYPDGARTKLPWVKFTHPFEGKTGVTDSVVTIMAEALLPKYTEISAYIHVDGASNISAIKPTRCVENEDKTVTGIFKLEMPLLHHMTTYELAVSAEKIKSGNHTFCAACSKDTKDVCGVCKFTYYCSNKCWKAKASIHGKVCRYVKRKQSKPKA